MPVKLPRGLAQFNRAIINPIQGQYAWLLPPWAVICHRGRKSGALYRTPVNAYKRGDMLAVAVLYGEQSDWVRNVLAGGGQVVRAGRTYELRDPRIVDPDSAESVPAAARMMARLSGRLLVARLGAPLPGFGRGPRPG
jgi:deazaflavin-dependent oxidoreductase (nitroreductase family)